MGAGGGAFGDGGGVPEGAVLVPNLVVHALPTSVAMETPRRATPGMAATGPTASPIAAPYAKGLPDINP